MTPIRPVLGEFDLGEFLGIGLDTAQIGHLAGALFLGLFSLSALRRVRQAAGPLPAVWIAVAVGLLAGAFLVAARGFPDQVPDELKPWADPDRLLRAAAVFCLLGCSIVLLSAHWVRRPLWRLVLRTIGLAVAGTALWLAAGWFGDQLPDEARPWAAREVVTRILAVAGLFILAVTFWFRPGDEAPHVRWATRSLATPAIAWAVVLGLRWFGPHVSPDIPVREVSRVAAMLAAVAAGTCGLIAAGAYGLRERPPTKRPRRRSSMVDPPIPLARTDRPLPVAVLLDEHGRPVLPVRPPQAGPSGA